MAMYYSSTTGSAIKDWRNCGGQQVYCDGICTKCNRAQVIYSTTNQTTANSVKIHIVRRPD